MLTLSRELHYVHEPFAPMYERAWVRTRPRERYLFLPPEAPSAWDADIERIVELRPPWRHIARRAGGARNHVRVAQEAVRTARARRRGARALIKDPFSLLLAEWIQSRTSAAVVVLVRHPAAFVSSVKRLQWRLPTGSLLAQPELMEQHLAAFGDRLERDQRGETDLIEHGCLIWSALNSVVASYAARHRSWNILRYEDLAQDPVGGFRRLYGDLQLAWSDGIEDRVADLNAARHGVDVQPGVPGGTRRDSAQAMWTWTDRLSVDEVERVRSLTQDVAELWYEQEDWMPPASTAGGSGPQDGTDAGGKKP